MLMKPGFLLSLSSKCVCPVALIIVTRRNQRYAPRKQFLLQHAAIIHRFFRLSLSLSLLLNVFIRRFSYPLRHNYKKSKENEIKFSTRLEFTKSMAFFQKGGANRQHQLPFDPRTRRRRRRNHSTIFFSNRHR